MPPVVTYFRQARALQKKPQIIVGFDYGGLTVAGVRVTADQAQQKWVTRISAATQDITNGVNRVTVAPGQLAAAQKNKWLANVTAAADKWQRNVGSVSLQMWQQYMTQVGIPRIAQGAQAKQAKYGAFAASFFPHLEAGIAKVNAMPSTTLEDNINRAVAMMRHNASFKRPTANG